MRRLGAARLATPRDRADTLGMALRHARSGQIVHLRSCDGTLPTELSHALFKSDQLEVLRLVLPAGRSFPTHRVAGELTIQCLEGRAEVRVGRIPQILGPGQLMHLEAGIEHSLVGIEDATLLMTIVLCHP
jgi:quercetin dioxygenase-like cupin family protein